MPNLVDVKYKQTGESLKTDEMGMRDMQKRAFEKRNSQYLLIKSPPASGKSFALMFLGLDKLYNQNIKKVIVSVPERAIGSSFDPVKLSDFGFFADWNPSSKYNLCIPGDSSSKVKRFEEFLKSDETILICTHATLRFAFDGVDTSEFNDCLIAIDEFHHVSAEDSSRLGNVLRNIMKETNAHIVAMTGSYFRGDSVPVLMPEDEAKFDKVTYNYYEQLNGYTYLKSLGIGYHFYQGKYTEAIIEVLDTNKKTIIHIPNINSGESTKKKQDEVDFILGKIGEIDHVDPKTGILYVKRHTDGKIIKVADLVEDTSLKRDKIINYLRKMKRLDDMDIIIALGMAKEGFDWPYCEHALTVGYRGSLTEIIQIIGRCTRDSENKNHAQFTNLVAQPDADQPEVKISVNNVLKAITASLLMEQVLAPNFKFKTKKNPDDIANPGELKIRGFKEPKSERVKQIVESDLNDLKANILQDNEMLKAMPGNIDAEVMNKVLIPKVIRTRYPDLNEEEIEELRQQVVVDSVVKNGHIKEVGDKKFLQMAGKFVNIDEISIDLIDTVNPFQRAYEILSKQVTTQALKVIQDVIHATKIIITEDEALILWPKIKIFVKENGRNPKLNATDPKEHRMAEVIIFLKNHKKKQEK